MKFVKLLTIPAVVVVSLLMAAPAFAHNFENGKLDSSCDKTTGQICLTLSGTIKPDFDKRTITFQLVGVKNGKETLLTGNTVSFDLPENHTNADVDFPATRKCFTAVTTGDFDSFTVKATSVTATGTTTAADLFMVVTVNGAKTTTTIQFPNEEAPITVVTGIAPCIENSPSPPPPPSGAGAGTPTTTTLAQTGGIDLRLPLVGVLLLAAGGALFVVSASRGRSSGTR